MLKLKTFETIAETVQYNYCWVKISLPSKYWLSVTKYVRTFLLFKVHSHYSFRLEIKKGGGGPTLRCEAKVGASSQRETFQDMFCKLARKLFALHVKRSSFSASTEVLKREKKTRSRSWPSRLTTIAPPFIATCTWRWIYDESKSNLDSLVRRSHQFCVVFTRFWGRLVDLSRRQKSNKAPMKPWASVEMCQGEE